MKFILEWLLSFFAPKKQKKIESKIEKLEDELKEIDDANNSPADNIDYLNK